MIEQVTVRKDGVDPYPDVLLRGETFLAIIQSLTYYDYRPLVDEWLGESGIGEIDPDDWYPRQEWLNLLMKLETQPGNAMQNQVAIGMKVIDNVALPEDFKLDSVFDAVNMLVGVYVENQRNLPEGDTGYEVVQIDEKHFEIEDTNPYLPFVNYGYIYGILQRFLGQPFVLEHEFMNKEEPLMGGVLFKVTLD